VSDENEYQHLATTMVSETRRINDIIQQFLQFTRPAELSKSSVNWQSIIAEVATIIRQEAKNRGVFVEENCQDVPAIDADADKLKQALLNLGQNALDACSKHDRIEFRCHHKHHRIQIEIVDTGSGIPSKDVAKLFNLYFTTKETGTGIGLSLVQQIISQHNGTIDVTSEEQQGTTFMITLPIA
jgi:two-component system sensor histidine kinase HydH